MGEDWFYSIFERAMRGLVETEAGE